jgi:hypothetical protein
MSAQPQPQQPQQLRDRITFRQGVPVEVQLERDGAPTHCAGQLGPEVRYFLEGHRIMWVPLEVADKIGNAQAGEGATYAITKHKAPQPWSVIHIEDEPVQWPAQQPAPSQGNGWPTAEQQPAPRPAAAPRQQAAPRPRQQAPARQPQNDALPQPTQMYAALCEAIRCACAAESYADKDIGYTLAFTSADIRAIAATIFIQAGGGR